MEQFEILFKEYKSSCDNLTDYMVNDMINKLNWFKTQEKIIINHDSDETLVDKVFVKNGELFVFGANFYNYKFKDLNLETQILIYKDFKNIWCLEKNLLDYVYHNFNTFIFNVKFTYSQMCFNRTPLKMENDRLYNHILDLIDDYITDYDLEENWFYEHFEDVDYIFEKLLDYFD
jgi:hypothetical protein